MRTRLSLTALGLLAALPAALPAQEYPSAPPAAGPVRPMPFPPFREFTLPNGLRVVLVESDKQPVISVSLSIPAGGIHDPADREGLAEWTAALLIKGAGERTAEQIAAAIEGVGGTLSASADSDFLTISSFVLTPHVELAFELLADAVMRPTFPEREVELLRTQTLSGLQLELSQPAAIAGRIMARELYGTHPYARRPTPASVRAITLAEIRDFAARRVVPQGALLVIAGDLNEAEARRLATSTLGGWTGAPPADRPLPSPPTRASTDILLVHRPGSVQADIRVGNLTYPPTNPQQYAARLANQVLGGAADSRLFMILREEKSWTYGAYSSLARPRGIGSFVATAEVRNEVADSALTELLAQIRRMTAEPIPATEFEAAKGAMVGRFPLQVETVQQVAAQVTSAKRLGLPDDYLATFRTRLAAVTPEQAMEAARLTMRPGSAAIVVVGDARELYDRLAAVAPVRLARPDGTPMERAELTAVATGPALNLDRLVARRDSFAITVQGNEFGHQVNTLERTPGGFTYRERVRIATFVEQDTEVVIGEDGSFRSGTQRGKVQGAESTVDLVVAAGRITGRVVIPETPMGPARDVAVDTLFPPGTQESNTLGALLPALPWAVGANWSFSVFNPTESSLGAVTIAVTGTETVEVPAGSFEVYRVEMASEGTVMTLFVTTAAPHTVVKMAPVGQPVEFVLVRSTTP
ncbi:MAG TPA: insulinase family protein [Gemmatimonadales bacterium]|nr:insulinase family protein [Gemmatimonadales bacterium]